MLREGAVGQEDVAKWSAFMEKGAPSQPQPQPQPLLVQGLTRFERISSALRWQGRVSRLKRSLNAGRDFS